LVATGPDVTKHIVELIASRDINSGSTTKESDCRLWPPKRKRKLMFKLSDGIANANNSS
jgi:hypothetical protein